MPDSLSLNLSSPDRRDALPREEQDELEESDTEERDFFGESVKEDSMNLTPSPLPRESVEEPLYWAEEGAVRRDVEEAWLQQYVEEAWL